MDGPSLPNDVEQLQTLVVQRDAKIDQLNTTVTDQDRRLKQLQHQVELLLRARYGRRSEKIDPNQLALFETPPEAADKPETPEVETTVKTHKRRRGGRQELPAHLPREVIEHDLSDAEKACPDCGEMRQRFGRDVSEQLEYIPAVLKVLQHVRYKYACKRCKEHVAIAPPPAKPIAKGLPGPGLLAALVVGKYADHLPLYRMEDVFARAGVEIPRSTLCRWVQGTAKLLRPLYEYMIGEIVQSEVIHTDDTPVPVLDPELPKTRTARLWVYCGDWKHPFTVYDYTTTRKRDGPATFLKDFCGYLQADAFAGYDGIYATGKVKQVLCWAHARRKFFEAKSVQPEAHEALAYIARLYAVEGEIKQTEVVVDRNYNQAIRRWLRSRRRHRQKYALPILAEFHAWLAKTKGKVLPKSPLGRAIEYVLPRWDGLTRYCEQGILAIDNNFSERMVRPCTIGRKNWLFFGSDSGGEAASILYSIMATAKYHSAEPFAYLRDVIAKAAEGDPKLDKLLPPRWLAEHPEHRREWAR